MRNEWHVARRGHARRTVALCQALPGNLPPKALEQARSKLRADTLAKSLAAGELRLHRNFELLFVAINTCLWKMAADGWNIESVNRDGKRMSKV